MNQAVDITNRRNWVASVTLIVKTAKPRCHVVVYYQLDQTQRLTVMVGGTGSAYSSQPSVTTLTGYRAAF